MYTEYLNAVLSVPVFGITVCCLQYKGSRNNCVLFAVFRYTVQMCDDCSVPVYGITVCCLLFTGICYKFVLFAVCRYTV